MLAAVSCLAVRRFVIVIMDVLGLDATMVPGTQVGRNRSVAAQLQRRSDQQHDQDSGNAVHAENPITDPSSQTCAPLRSSGNRRRVAQRLLRSQVTASAAEPSARMHRRPAKI